MWCIEKQTSDDKKHYKNKGNHISDDDNLNIISYTMQPDKAIAVENSPQITLQLFALQKSKWQ